MGGAYVIETGMNWPKKKQTQRAMFYEVYVGRMLKHTNKTNIKKDQIERLFWKKRIISLTFHQPVRLVLTVLAY